MKEHKLSEKELQHEVTAFEGRLSAAKSEVETLTRKRDSIKAEIESIIAVAKQDTDKQVLAARKAGSKVDEERKKLEFDREALNELMLDFRKEKQQFEKEKELIYATRDESKRVTDNVAEFIRLVRDGAAKL